MFVIDRFEGKWAVIEYEKETFNLPKKIFPPEAKEGDVLDILAARNFNGKDLGKDKEIIMRHRTMDNRVRTKRVA